MKLKNIICTWTISEKWSRIVSTKTDARNVCNCWKYFCIFPEPVFLYNTMNKKPKECCVMNEYKKQVIKLVNCVEDKAMLDLIYQLLKKHLSKA